MEGGAKHAETAVERIVRFIQRAREDGQLHPGDRLPSERDLASQFGVSRPTVREALRSLQVMGLVEGRKGSGSYVRDSQVDGAHISPQTVMEARLAIEPYLTSLAAARATLMEMNKLEDNVHAASKCTADFEELDGFFHLQIAEYARNDLLREFAQLLHTARSDVLWGNLKRSVLQRSNTRQTYLRQHREILDNLRARDSAQAGAAARIHVETVYRHMFGDQAHSMRPV